MGIGSRTLALAVLVACVTGCASAAPPTRNDTASSSSPVQVSVPGKPLRATLYEPPALGGAKFSGLSSLRDYTLLFGGYLTDLDAAGNPVPRLVADIPSLEAGTWRVLADNRMETTYRLRPGVTWHDGAPFTVDNVIFSWQAIMHPALPAGDRIPERLIEAIEPVDAHTFRLVWKQIYIDADAWDLEPLPKHILDPLLQEDPQRFLNSAHWSSEYVGLGPYRLAEWVPGSYVKGIAFPQYALGPPKIEEVYVHFVTGAQPAVAALLAGTVDLPLGSLLLVEEAMLLKQQMEPRGEALILTSPYSMRVADLQLRDPTAPAARDVRVRRAMVHAVDRPLMVESLHFGLTAPAETFAFPNEAVFSRVDRAIMKYPFSVTQAARLLAEAGWEKSPDGVLRDQEGRRFPAFHMHSLESAQFVNEAQVIADSWNVVGIASEIEVIPRARQNDRQYRAQFSGAAYRSYSRGQAAWLDRWKSSESPTEANQWRGANAGSYGNDTVDQLSATYRNTIDPLKRQDLSVDFFKILAEDVPTIPFYYTVRVYVVRTGLKGVEPTAGGGDTLFNVHQMYWER